MIAGLLVPQRGSVSHCESTPRFHTITPGSTVYTDGLKGFEDLKAAGVKHVARTQPLRSDLRKGAPSVVPLTDRAIGNMQ